MSARVNFNERARQGKDFSWSKEKLVRFLIRKGKVEVKEKEKNFLETAAPKEK
jgi:hypothetical protein